MTDRREQLVVADAMQQRGGGFVSKLGAALEKADPSNAARIKAAFPEYWQQYLALGKALSQEVE